MSAFSDRDEREMSFKMFASCFRIFKADLTENDQLKFWYYVAVDQATKSNQISKTYGLSTDNLADFMRDALCSEVQGIGASISKSR
eukprot:CAMPEP_0113728422 /NCGR_PEP_ID=MMETSP0038_2-20120614/41875_1 /TAXON_ID=2898 /ORGANISM="Cryptomonas paramecium" /LENGTH=85 /DNA_ID=CAMNT_0000659931 /DNA_START=1 /DNA_END=254 /DNA_ORIENTATION=- /assembly_acc=CAM_ASM_000170